jgi:hypothetical protein
MKILFNTGMKQTDPEGNGTYYIKFSAETSDVESFQKFVQAIRGAMAPEAEEKPAAMGFQKDGEEDE